MVAMAPRCLSDHLALCSLQAQVSWSLNLRLAPTALPTLDRRLCSGLFRGPHRPVCCHSALFLSRACSDYCLSQPYSCLSGPRPSSDLLLPLPGCGRWDESILPCLCFDIFLNQPPSGYFSHHRKRRRTKNAYSTGLT